MSVLIANNASSPIAAPVTTGSGTVTVQLGTGVKFGPPPVSPDVQYCTIISALNPAVFEIVRVTARVGDVFTIVRAQDGTAAQAFSIGDTFALLPTRVTDNALRNTISLPTSTGSANAQVVTNTVPVNVLDVGVVQEFIPGFTNTGTSVSLDIDGTGVFPLEAFGAPPWPGMLVMGVVARVAFDGSNYQLQNPQIDYIALPSGGGTGNAQTVTNPVNPFKALNRGIVQRYLPSAVNTGPATFAPDGLTPTAIEYKGAALVGGEFSANVSAILIYNGTVWDLINSNLTPTLYVGDAAIYFANSTFTPSVSGLYLVKGRGGGGGGGAGGGSSSPGGNSVGGSGGEGGGGGGETEELVALVAGTNYAVVIGSHGAGGATGGAGVNGNDGADGNDTSFNGVVLGSGGKGGRGGMSLVTVNGKGLPGSNGGGNGGGDGGSGQNSANAAGHDGTAASSPGGIGGGGGGGGGGAPSAGGTEQGGAGGDGADGWVTVQRVA